MVGQANKLTAMLQQLAVITFKVDNILDTTKQNAESNKRGKLYSGYETMRRTMLELLVDITEEEANETIKAEG